MSIGKLLGGAITVVCLLLAFNKDKMVSQLFSISEEKDNVLIP